MLYEVVDKSLWVAVVGADGIEANSWDEMLEDAEPISLIDTILKRKVNPVYALLKLKVYSLK